MTLTLVLVLVLVLVTLARAAPPGFSAAATEVTASPIGVRAVRAGGLVPYRGGGVRPCGRVGQAMEGGCGAQ
ncbi:hypothetical protein ACIQRK_21895 [Streptomyces anulatus]